MTDWYFAGRERMGLPVAGAGGGGGGGPAFPTLTGLIGRYMADTGVTLSGPNVTAVVNQANPGTNDLTSGGGNVPFNASSAYNSKPAFDFVAANGAWLSTGSFPMGTGGNVSVFVVGQMSSNTSAFGGAVAYGVTGNDFSTSGNAALVTRDNTNAGIAFSSSTSSASGSMSTGANHRFGEVFDSGVANTLYVDNAQVGSQGFATQTFVDNGTLVIGNRFSSGAPGGNAWDGPILEVVVCNAALSSTELNNLDNYFTGKYGT